MNHWGGPDSVAKREWFAQATIDVLNDEPDADSDWIEEFLLQVMLDEFEVNVDDESGFEVAEQIVRMRRDCGKGNFSEVIALKERWDRRRGADVLQGQFKEQHRTDEEDETDGSEEEGEQEDMDVDMDVDMEVAPQLVPEEKPIPEIDEDGFTKVTKKRR
jgi:pre-rRNA-processing protein TSR2